jgi:phasin family protein
MTSKKSKRQPAHENRPEAVDFEQKSIEQLEVVVQEVSAVVPGSLTVVTNPGIESSSAVLDFQRKAMEFASANIEQAFEFSRQFFDVKEFAEAADLQNGFFKAQAESFKAQTVELNEIALRVSNEATKPLKESFEKSVQALTRSFAA